MRGRQGRVIEAIGRAIVSGGFAPGEILPKESILTDTYQVSRTSIREAMKVLAAKGLVEIRPKTGTKVRPRDVWNAFDSDLLSWISKEAEGAAFLHDLVEFRQIAEPAAARLAASRATIADLARIEATATGMLGSTSDAERYAEQDVAFHLAVYAASHNAFLSRFGLLVADFLKISFDLQQQARSVEFEKDAAGHRAVFEAINRGDAESAAHAMLEVVLDGKGALISALSAIDRD